MYFLFDYYLEEIKERLVTLITTSKLLYIVFFLTEFTKYA